MLVGRSLVRRRRRRRFARQCCHGYQQVGRTRQAGNERLPVHHRRRASKTVSTDAILGSVAVQIWLVLQGADVIVQFFLGRRLAGSGCNGLSVVVDLPLPGIGILHLSQCDRFRHARLLFIIKLN